MANTETAFDERVGEPDRFPVAKLKPLASHLITGAAATSITSNKFGANGVVKQIKYDAPNLATDTEFTLQILDRDGGVVYTATLADNKAATYSRIAEDSAPLLCSGAKDYYTIKVSWVTGQEVAANAFNIELFLT